MMHDLRLLGAAVQAEGICLRREIAAYARFAALAIAAGIFGLLVVLLVQLAVGVWLHDRYGAIPAALLLAMANAVVMVGIILATRRHADPLAEEALRLRQQSLTLLTEASPAQSGLGGTRWRGAAFEIGGMLGEILSTVVERRLASRSATSVVDRR